MDQRDLGDLERRRDQRAERSGHGNIRLHPGDGDVTKEAFWCGLGAKPVHAGPNVFGQCIEPGDRNDEDALVEAVDTRPNLGNGWRWLNA